MTGCPDDAVSLPRRALLTSGVVALAGCQSGGDDAETTDDPTATGTETQTETATATPTEQVADATLTLQPTDYIPDASQFRVGDAFEQARDGAAFTELPDVCFDRLATTDAEGRVVGMALSDWTFADDRIEVTVNEDVGWSDGSPARGADWGAHQQLRRWTDAWRSPEAVADAGDPRSVLEATREVTWGGQTATMHAVEDDEGGLYRLFPAGRWLREEVAGSHLTFHRDHTRPFVEAIRDEVSDPYSEDGQTEIDLILSGVTFPDGETATSEATPTTTADDGDDGLPPVSGPFQPEALEANERIVLRRNPHFRLADRINWSGLTYERVASDSAWDAVTSGALDAAEVHAEPSEVDDRAPSVRLHRGEGHPEALAVNQFSDSHLADPQVRWALSDALNRAAFTDRYDRTVPGTPGIDYPEREQDVSDDLAESFRDLTLNRDRAARRLRDVGFTREDGAWHTPGGERWSPTLLAHDGDTSVASTVVDHFTAFGVDASVDAVDDETFDERVAAGEWELRVTSTRRRPFGLYESAFRSERYSDRYRVWDWDAVVEWAETTEGGAARDYGWLAIEGFTPELLQDRWTKAAPPVGEPESDERIEYPVVAHAEQVTFGPVVAASNHDLRRRLAWVYNWRLPVIPLYLDHEVVAFDHSEWAVTPSAATEEFEVTRLLQQGRIRLKR